MGINQFLQQTHSELKQVHWPTRQQTIIFTVVVVLVSVLVGYLLGAFDWLFKLILQSFIR